MKKVTPFVYFISSDDGPIKIGKATDVRKRLAALQTSHFKQLHVIGVMAGDDFLEGKLHEKFRELRLRGEWFRRTSDLINFILENRNASIWPEFAPLKPFIPVDVGETPYGVVQVVSEGGDHHHEGEYGFWDDCDSEMILECDFCIEARRRGVDTGEHECTKCIYSERALVYFGPIEEGYTLVDPDDIRRVDDEFEEARILQVRHRFWSGRLDEAMT